MSVEDISALKGELEQMQSTQARMSSYKLLNDYLGREYIESERYGALASQDDRERFTWESGDDDTDYVVNITKTHLIIQDQVSFLGAERNVRVPVRVPEAQQYCDKLERAIIDLWRMWNMQRRWQEVAWYAVVYGTGVGVLQWDKAQKVPIFRAKSPENLLVQPSVDDETKPQIAVFTTETLGRSIIGDYPELAKKIDMGTEYDVVDYYSVDERVRFIDGENIELLRAKNPLNTLPIYLFPGIIVPGSLTGASMLLRTVPPEKEMNRLYSQQALYLRDVVEAPMQINDPVNVPENARWNRDCTIEVGPQGGVRRAQISQMDGQMLQMRLNDMERNIQQTMDFSPVQQGEAVGSYLTGKGVTALQQPLIQRMIAKLQPHMPLYAQANKDALLLWNKAGGNKNRTIYGDKGGSMFAEEFNPKEDIDPGYVENLVHLDTASFIDRSAVKVTNLQELGAGVKSKRRYLENDPECDDVELEMQRIDEEKMHDIQIEAQAAQMMQAAQQPQMPQGMPGQPGMPPGEPGMEGAPPEGNAGLTPPEGGIPLEGAGGAEMTPGMTDEASAEDILGPVADTFRSIGKIKGQVFLVGAILNDGLTPEEIADPSLFIDVVVTDLNDKQTILNGLRQTELRELADQGKLAWHENLDMLDSHPYLEVTPGTSGTELQQGPQQPPEEQDVGPGLPEDEMGGAPPGMGGMPPEGMPPEMMGMV